MRYYHRFSSLMLSLLKVVKKYSTEFAEQFTSPTAYTLFVQSVIVWTASFLTGVCAVAYAKIFDLAENANKSWFGKYPELIFFVTPLGFILARWVVKRYAPGASGSGIPQLMAAVELANAQERHLVRHFLSAKILIIKALSSVIMIFSGSASGREGPTLQIAGSVFKIIHDFIPKGVPKVSERIMVMTGGAAGLAAAFNTPLGGIVFVVEDLAKIHITRFRNFVFTGVIIAGLTAQWLLGSYLMFGYPKTETSGVQVFSLALITGILCGLAGGIFTQSILAFGRYRSKVINGPFAFLFVGLVGLCAACLIYFFSHEAIGSGREQIHALLFAEQKSVAGHTFIARFIGPLLSTATGAVAGTFAPALALGGLIGGGVGQYFEIAPGAFNLLVLCGMTAFLASVTRAPFTAAILVLEMTDRHSVIFHLILAAMLGYLAAGLIQKKGIYEIQKDDFIRKLATKSEVLPAEQQE